MIDLRQYLRGEDDSVAPSSRVMATDGTAAGSSAADPANSERGHEFKLLLKVSDLPRSWSHSCVIEAGELQSDKD